MVTHAHQDILDEKAYSKHEEFAEGMPDEANVLTPEELEIEKKLRRKIDLLIMPLVVLVYLMNYIDRNNYAAARLQGLEKDLGLVGDQYQIGLSLFFVSYILAQLPSNLLLNYCGRPSWYLGFFIMAWGLVSAVTSQVQSFAGILVCRVVLGFTEAPFFPGILFYLSKWYTKKELNLRMSLFYAGSLLSGAFGSLIAAGILRGLDGHNGLGAWQWLYIIEGVITIGVGAIVVFVLPDFPETWKALSPEMRHVATKRLTLDATEADQDEEGGMSQLKGMKLAVADPKTWLLAFMYLGVTGAAGFQNFFPTLTKSLGYGPFISLLLVAPPYIFMVFWSLLHSWASDKVSNRFWFFVYPIPLAIIGMVVFMTTHGFGPRYFSFFLMMFVFTINGTIYAWISNAIPRPPAKRAAALAIMNALGNSTSVWTSFTYRPGDKPYYRLGLGIAAGLLVMSFVLACVLRLYLQRQNKALEELENEGTNLSPERLSTLMKRAEIHDLCRVKVRVEGEDEDGNVVSSLWSDETTIEFVPPHDQLTAQFIGSYEPQPQSGIQLSPRPLRFRKSFNVPEYDGIVDKAELYITAYGVYQVFINGERVGNDEMAPGWTSYTHRHIYQTCDVRKFLRPGDNVIGVEVAEGWYAGRLGWAGQRQFYGKDLGVFAQLEVVSTERQGAVTIATDDTWECGPGPIISSQIYDGELYDAREDQLGWNKDTEFQRIGWRTTKVLPFTRAKLLPSEVPPVRVTERIRPTRIFNSKSGKTLIDFGQNIVGKLFVKHLQKPVDHITVFRHAEVIEDGELGVFGPSASFLFDTDAMLSHWLEDVASEQAENDGIPPFVVPNILASDKGDKSWGNFPQAVWDDVVILLPWHLYRAFGDIEILKRQYPSMQMWLEKGVRRGNDDLWDPSFHQLGDWLDPSAPPDRPGEAKTDGTFVADAYLVHVTHLMSMISECIGYKGEAARYAVEHKKLKKAFGRKYITIEGLPVADTQTGLALAIVFDLFKTPDQAKVAAARLERAVKLANFKVATGFAGTPIVTHALSSVGLQNLAYRMLSEKECPSWLYPITMGATTIWERWNSMLPDGSINPGEMTSFNHYALGSIVNWLHSVVGGISPLQPGWKHSLVRPVPGGSLTHAEVRHRTPYGMLECKWSINAGQFKVSLTVPPNTTARVVMPDKQASKTLGEEEEGIEVGSGIYEFSCAHVAEEWKPTAIPIPFYTPVSKERW
ncbi:permease of the major facilitator superfamily [Aureobasidium sp. EXF-10727]|nr:permease of the major facilitator superfamily [Aureobasidium sp. EXF-10727]